MQCNVFWTELKEPIPDSVAELILRYYPAEESDMISKLHFQSDRDLTVAGKALLKVALMHHNLDISTVNSISRDTYNKPYLKCNLHYNISHSGTIVVCAASMDADVGIDIEQIVPTELDDFQRCFTNKELSEIRGSNDSLREFYRFWTRKEAFLKAIGMGIVLDLRSIDCTGNILWDQQEWYLSPLDLHSSYAGHLAVPEPNVTIKYHRININDAINSIEIYQHIMDGFASIS